MWKSFNYTKQKETSSHPFHKFGWILNMFQYWMMFLLFHRTSCLVADMTLDGHNLQSSENQLFDRHLGIWSHRVCCKVTSGKIAGVTQFITYEGHSLYLRFCNIADKLLESKLISRVTLSQDEVVQIKFPSVGLYNLWWFGLYYWMFAFFLKSAMTASKVPEKL